MKLQKTEQLFFGCKIDSKLREGLSQAKPGDRRYFEDTTNTEFLRVCQLGDERWIGKVVTGGVNVGDVEDIQRNVVSILRRIVPNVRTSPSSIRIFAVIDDGQVATASALDAVPESIDEAAAPEKEDGGPYIDYDY